MPITAYILAGGRSSRMGRDKALIELAGKPLILHATTKLRRLTPHVQILSSNPALAPYAPLLPDIHPGTGPIGGIEAALTHLSTDWSLIYPVDVPFLPTAFLDHWVRDTLRDQARGARLAIFTVDGVAQPALALLHKDVLPFISQAIQQGDYKLNPVLQGAGRELAAQQNVLLGRAFRNMPWNPDGEFSTTSGIYGPSQEPWRFTTPAQQRAKHLWFANLNTPADLAEAQFHLEALDT